LYGNNNKVQEGFQMNEIANTVNTDSIKEALHQPFNCVQISIHVILVLKSMKTQKLTDETAGELFGKSKFQQSQTDFRVY
jgi:hypothetical protein